MVDRIDPNDLPQIPSVEEPTTAADEANYKVGYKNPPRGSRWKPGQSGHIKGRPPGSRSFKTELREILEQKISVTENGRKRTMSARQAMMVRLRQKGLSGDQAAIDRLLRLAANHLPDEVPVDHDATAAADEALIAEHEAEVIRRYARREDDDD